MFERINNILNQIVGSYNTILNYETQGSSKDSLRNELINIRNACDEIPTAIALTLKETIGITGIVEQLKSIQSIIDVLKTPFLETIKTQIMLLSLDNVPDNLEWIKGQANLSITAMNLDGTINKLKAVHVLLK